MKKEIGLNRLVLGTCYYPEHWDASLWDDDLRRMEEYGIEVIRIAEFAWSFFEPEEGVYTFDFFDRFMEVVEKHPKIKVIFCTPTATPPAWLTEKYPEVLNARVDGTVLRHGGRRHYNYNSEVYNEFTRKIVTKLAEHYGHHPSIIGWQIDNELNCGTDVFYSACDHRAFRVFLQKKYGTLDALNRAWGTDFWNQQYTSWDQVHLQRPTAQDEPNPHLALDSLRFFSDSCIRYCKLHYDILRSSISEKQFVTTNGMFSHLDNHEMTDIALDFFTYDSYPGFGYSPERSDHDLYDRKWSYNLSKVRSICPTFGIMEQQSGPGGWVKKQTMRSPKPGQMRLWTFQSVAHGADYVSYFRWRTCSFGTEIYWHGINDYSNVPNRRCEELCRIHADFQKASALAGAKYRAQIALLRDYDNEWDGELDKWHGPLTWQSETAWFKASTFTHTPMDVVQLRESTTAAELGKYKMAIYPHAAILTEERAQILAEYVRQGGILIMGARTGYKDTEGHCPMMPMPGYASALCGVEVADFTTIFPEDTVRLDLNGTTLKASLFSDILKVTGENTRLLGTFASDYYQDEPAVTENSFGEGKAVYFGSAFTRESAEALLRLYGLADPCQELLELPACCELAVREKEGKQYYFVLNYDTQKAAIKLHTPMKDLLSEKTLSGDSELEGFGVYILEK